MKRLLCLISCMDAGGAETFLMKLYRRLDRTQYQMDFCVNVQKKCFYDDEIKSLGGRIFYVPPKSHGAKAFSNELSRLIKQEGYEYVLRITSNAAGFWDLKIAKDAGATRCIARSSNSKDEGGWKALLVHRAAKLLFRNCVDVMIAPSDLAAEYTFGKRAVLDGRVNFLNNAVDMEQYSYRESADLAIRQEFGLENKFIVGHVGRFFHQKNHEFLLRIFAVIARKRPDAVLMLVGSGELEQQVREQAVHLDIADRVVFTGVRRDVSRLLSAMDVFVFPSFYEGMPNTVIEAQASGLPCIIADTITREANITGLVQYLALSQSEDEWAHAALTAALTERMDTRAKFREYGYDIESAVTQFTRLVFE